MESTLDGPMQGQQAWYWLLILALYEVYVGVRVRVLTVCTCSHGLRASFNALPCAKLQTCKNPRVSEKLLFLGFVLGFDVSAK